MGVLQMPRSKGADVQFIIYVPHDGRSVSHEAKIKKNKTTDRLISFRALRPTPVLYHPVISSPRAAITPNVLTPLVHLTLFFVSLPLVYPPHTHKTSVFFSLRLFAFPPLRFLFQPSTAAHGIRSEPSYSGSADLAAFQGNARD